MTSVVKASDASRVLDLTFANSGAQSFAPFSDFVIYDDPLGIIPKDNPAQGPEYWLQNKQMYWKTLAETLANRPMILNGTLKRYMTDVSRRVFGAFPIAWDTRGRWSQNTIRMKPNYVAPGTRKVPGREISVTFERKEYSAIYTGEGFEADYSGMQTPEGMAFFDLLFGQVVSDIMRIIVFNMYDTFMQEPSPYLGAGMRFPHEALIPSTPEHAFDYFFQKQALVLNKQPLMIHNLIADASRMFEAAGEPPVAVMFMTEEVKRHITRMDESNLFYEDTGPSAIANRTTSVSAGSVRAGIEIMTIQMLGEDNDNIYNKAVLSDRWQMGGLARFVEPSGHVCARKYRSADRNGRWSSWYSDRPEEHPLIDAFRHMFEFVPRDYEPAENEHVSPGEIDTRLLFGLIDNAEIAYRRTRCRVQNNEDACHQFLQVMNPGAAEPKYFPIMTFGEIAPRFLSDKNLRLPFATMHARIVDALSEDEMAILEGGFALAKRLANPTWLPDARNIAAHYPAEFGRNKDGEPGRPPVTRVNGNIQLDMSADGLFDLAGAADIAVPYGLGTYAGFRTILKSGADKVDNGIINKVAEFLPVFEKLVTVLIEINKAHPALDPENVPLFHINATTFERICIAAWNNLVEGGMYPHAASIAGGLKVNILLHFDIDETGKAKDHSLLSRKHWEGVYLADELLNVETIDRKVFTQAEFDANMAKPGRTAWRFAMASPWHNEHFRRRWDAARGAPTWHRLAQFAVLLQEIHLTGIEGWWDANVAIPLGASMVRPFEEIAVDSIVMASRREIGRTKFSGLDDIVSFDGNSQHYGVDIDGHFRSMPYDNLRFLVMDRVRGRRVVGGKGNRYINANPEVDGPTVMRTGTVEFQETVREHFGNAELLGQYSMIAMLEGYNASIDNPFARRHVPLTGYWDKEYFVGMIANSTAFQDVYDAPNGINQFLFNYLFPGLIAHRPQRIDERKATHAEVAELWRHNVHVHQITQWVKNPLTGNWDEINSSHPCDREVDNIRGIQSSLVPVRRHPRVPNKGLPPPVPEAY